MIWDFGKGLWPSVRVEMEQRGQELDRFKELVKKTVDAKVKAALKPRSYICKTNQHCLWGSWPSAAKASTYIQLVRDPRVEKFKSRPQESKNLALQHSNSAETFEQARKE